MPDRLETFHWFTIVSHIPREVSHMAVAIQADTATVIPPQKERV